MTDFVDNLTDAELRTKLAEYGFPVVPITNTTRKVMAKKLKMLIDNKNKITSEGRRSLAKYSSEEESDDDVKSKKDKNRRMTVGTGMLPPVSTNKPTRKSTKKVDTSFGDTIPTSASFTETKSRRTTRLIKPVLEADLETGSDSEPEIVDEYVNNDSSTRPGYWPSYTSSPAPSSSPITSNTSSYTSKTTSSSRYSVTEVEPTSSAEESSVERLNQIRSRLSLGSPLDRRAAGAGDEIRTDTPYLSNFSKRLSQISNASALNYKNDIIKEHDVNGSSYNRLYLSRARNRDYPQDFKSSQEKNIFKNNFVSFTLLGIAVAFFIAITIMYVGIRSDQSVSENAGYVIPLCEEMDIGAKPGLNCIFKDATTDALNLLKVLKPELIKRTLAHHCTDSNVKPYMDDGQIIQFVSANYALTDPYEIQKGVHNLQVLIFKNPKWGLSVIQTESAALESIDQISNDRMRRNLAISILNPDLPWKCTVLNKFYTVISSILVIGIGFLILYSGHKAYKYYWNLKKSRSQKVYKMVEKIIDILQSNASDNSDNFLAVNHIRDMLIAPHEKKAMASIWAEAVKFLTENESRIRTEVQIISGEEFQVWRWLGSSSPKSKSWQGQAFETQVGSVNSLPCSPTQCLKVRGMFDERERDLFTVREAVLSKCATKCKILHCEVDLNSVCVYIKCANQAEAAVAYQNLQGWWYDGRLLTVKYLRLERYMQRFPNSPTKGPPFLTPSTAQSLENDWSNNDD